MASSNAANMSKAQQHSQRKFAESSSRVLVSLHKTDVKMKKMMDSLEQQQHTAVNNIANHQQAMKMSWRRLEEKRSSSPNMTRAEKTQQAKGSKKGMLLQSSTKLSVDKTPEIYDTRSSRPTTVDDSVMGRVSEARMQGHIFRNKLPRDGPPPTQLTRAHTSPYISSPLNFRKSVPDKTMEEDDKGELSDSQDLSSSVSSSQPVVVKSSAINSKETLLRASTLMDMKSTSTGSAGFKGFYLDRPRSQSRRSAPLSPLAMSQLQDIIPPPDKEEDEEEAAASNSLPSLAEQFEQIKTCKYIRHSHHYHPELAAEDDFDKN